MKWALQVDPTSGFPFILRLYLPKAPIVRSYHVRTIRQEVQQHKGESSTSQLVQDRL